MNTQTTIKEQAHEEESLNPTRVVKWSQYGSNRTEQRQNMDKMSANEMLQFENDADTRSGGVFDFNYFDRVIDDALVKRIRNAFVNVVKAFDSIRVDKDHADPTVEAFTLELKSTAEPQTVVNYLNGKFKEKMGGRKGYIVTVNIIQAEGDTVIAHVTY